MSQDSTWTKYNDVLFQISIFLLNCEEDHMGGSTPETLAVYSGFFFDDVVLLLNVSS